MLEKRILPILLCVALLFSMFSSLPVSVVKAETDPSLKLWYKFNETVGSNVYDYSGNNRDGALIGTGAAWLGGEGLAFNGTSSYVKVPDNVLSGVTSVTVSTMVYVNTSLTANYMMFAFGNTLSNNGNGYLYMSGDAFRAGLTTGSWQTEQNAARASGGNLAKGVWKHVAFTLSGSTAYLYEDGIQVGTKTGVTINPSQIGNGTTTANYIGRSVYNADKYFNGKMKDFRIYDRALNPSEISMLSGNTAAITAVALPELKTAAMIDTQNFKVTIPIKLGSHIQSLAPSFTLSGGASMSPASGTAMDFTNPVTYTVTGADGKIQAWTVQAKIMNSPAIDGLYADPNVIAFGNKYYIYPTTDGFANWSGTQFKAFSSDDLVNWTDHGVIFDVPNHTTWATGKAWAPAIIEKNGKYYFYFCGSSQIGVAVSDSPTGPFVDALGHPLIAAGQYSGQMIDPMAFTDDDGQSYLYFGNGNAYVVKLNEDMISLNGTATNITSSAPGYREGAFVIKRNNKYYFMWSENDTRDENYRVAYAIGDSPMGPFTKQSVILAKDLSLGIKGPGHHSVLKIPGKDEYYMVYHRFAIPGGDGTHREVVIDKMEFNTDGTIKNVVPTLEGITTPVIIQNIPPAAPNVTLNDETNIVTGLTTAMEYKLDSAGYVLYDPTTFAALDLSGSHTLLIRIAANEATGAPVGDVTTLIFTQNEIVPADLNGDGIVGIGDIGIMAAHYGKNSTDPSWHSYKNADLNNDGVIDIIDLAATASSLLSK